jgi:hypothetical protein
MRIRLKDIENHLERADARIKRFEQIEAVRERNKLINLVIKLMVGMFAVLCAVSAIYNQF